MRLEGSNDYFTKDMKKMILKMRIMARIKYGKVYSYGLVKEFGDSHFAKMMGSSLKNDIYNTITSLKKGGYIRESKKIEKGRAKKYYTITRRGESVMKSATLIQKETLREISKLFK